MPTMLVKGLTREQVKELRKLKAELGCRTWADLLGVLAEARGPEMVRGQRLEQRLADAEGFLSLEKEVSDRWRGQENVLNEFRKSRRHGD